MKKRFLLFLAALCSIGYYSCTKNVDTEVAAAEQENSLATDAQRGGGHDDDCNAVPGSTIFDIKCLVSPSARGKLDTIQKGFGFTEGPAVDKNGNVFFTDQPNDKIYRWDAGNGTITTFLTGTGRSNGMAFDKQGNLIACADMHGELWKIRPNGSHTVLANNYNGKLLNGPNDVWINPATGGIYITDPIFPRGYWDNNDPRKIGNPGWPPVHSEQAATGKGGHVYYLAPGSHTLERVTTQPGWNADVWPNGVVGTPDGKKLYVNEWTGDNTGTLWEFDILRSGRLTNMRVLVDNLRGCDGMSMDERGDIFISHADGVTAFDKRGNKIFNVPCGPGNNKGATNNVFAGRNNKLLFITGTADRVTSLKMNVEGVERFDGKDRRWDDDDDHHH